MLQAAVGVGVVLGRMSHCTLRTCIEATVVTFKLCKLISSVSNLKVKQVLYVYFKVRQIETERGTIKSTITE